MKKMFMIGLVAATSLASTAIAQSVVVPGTVAVPGAVAPAATLMTLPRIEAGQMLTSTLVGTAVYNTAEEKIGDVNDIVIDTTGKVVGVVIGVGGFLGMGEKNIAFAYPSVTMTKDARGNDRLTVSATKDQLKTFTPYAAKAS